MEKQKQLIDEMEKDNAFLSKYLHYKRIDKWKAWLDFCRRIGRKPIPTFRWQVVFRYAAAILLLPACMLAVYFILLKAPDDTRQTLAEIRQGTSQAVLILSNGEEVALNAETAEKVAVSESGTATVNNDRISYHNNESVATEQYNTIVTQRGGEYRIELDDGTQVHLNAASQLKYPVAFTGVERTVYLQGEAYFEIAPDSTRPFYVVTDEIKVRQYGTRFNVYAYQNEPATEVILVKGSIGIIIAGEERLLMPGQLAEWNTESHRLEVKNVDVEAYVAWNDGRFHFDNKSLKEIMDVLSRWYNIDIEFIADDVQSLHFTGSFDRYDTIEPIIQAICHSSNMKAEIKNHKLYIFKL
ncbi:MAG: DUF4974 domain-containing protein [Dysgonamonadaceae bacterium]|jgi:ferric-dicitrate binding protein FerR (iron transport regulator)|nr:DUF4974 domain-containing protein [Dysgonamonadaceae bacterium]